LKNFPESQLTKFLQFK